MTSETRGSDFYNEAYKHENFFRHQTWLYGPYVSSLIGFSGLKEGSSVLDVGCGQGLFSYLFSMHGMKVHGIDLSETGIRAALNKYGRFGVTFSVGDIQTAVFPEQFDCVFVRSCSLYNTDAFRSQRAVTDSLLTPLKPGGTFIFAYNSNFSSKRGAQWRYHSLADAQQHFGGYPGAEFFFLNPIATWALRRHSITPLLTRVNIFLSRVSRRGGELLCVFKKTQELP